MVAEIVLGVLAALSLLGGLLGLPALLLLPQITPAQEAIVLLMWLIFAVSFAGAMTLHHLRHARQALQRLEAVLERR
ncbi:MAG: hypothetical protein N2688_01820 [Burkholderiaceae bacterium]|nr:hypothetical protein [Burkholderiaceae bacterium]